MAEQVIAKAVTAGNGEDVAKAIKYRDAAIQRATQLHAVKQNELQRQNTPVQPQVDSRVLSYAQEFMKEHPWYDVQGRDEDSAVVLAIDSAMAKDGYDPKLRNIGTSCAQGCRVGCRIRCKTRISRSERRSGSWIRERACANVHAQGNIHQPGAKAGIGGSWSVGRPRAKAKVR